MEIVVSITVQDKKVCFNDNLKNSLKIQNPESLTCEPNTLPVPTANTINSGETFPAVINGTMIAAAVCPATVAEPMATRSNAVTTQANTSGDIFIFLLKEEMYSPVPVSCNTCLKTPPA